MPGPELPDATRDFIVRYVRSVEELEILLLLHGRPERAWTVDAVYDVILSAKTSVERRLDELVAAGLVGKTGESDATYQFLARGPLAGEVEALAALYKLKPVRVIEAIFKKKSDPVQGFADAFKLNPRE